MEAARADRIPEGDVWQFEPKWDGFRAIVFRDGDNVALVAPDDADALAATIERLLDHVEERRALAEGARRASADFAWPRIAERALELYREALR